MQRGLAPSRAEAAWARSPSARKIRALLTPAQKSSSTWPAQIPARSTDPPARARRVPRRASHPRPPRPEASLSTMSVTRVNQTSAPARSPASQRACASSSSRQELTVGRRFDPERPPRPRARRRLAAGHPSPDAPAPRRCRAPSASCSCSRARQRCEHPPRRAGRLRVARPRRGREHGSPGTRASVPGRCSTTAVPRGPRRRVVPALGQARTADDHGPGEDAQGIQHPLSRRVLEGPARTGPPLHPSRPGPLRRTSATSSSEPASSGRCRPTRCAITLIWSTASRKRCRLTKRAHQATSMMVGRFAVGIWLLMPSSVLSMVASRPPSYRDVT